MSDNTSIPILLDGDTGYGNFNNARRLIRKLEQRGIAGVCIEDKLFPKTNSLLEGVSQPLADIDEFCGKIQACKDAQKDDAFSGPFPPPTFSFSFLFFPFSFSFIL
jgi:phosphoenolpyruvate phosphomutase